MEDEEEGIRSSENGTESIVDEKQDPEEEGKEEHVLGFLDSMDSYLILMDSLSSTLRQGWMELASARHSMGASRINSAVFDLKHHAAATSLEVNCLDAGSTMKQPDFTLYKWACPDNRKLCAMEAKFKEDDLLQRKSSSPQLRQRGASLYSEFQEKGPESNRCSLTVDNQVQKERSKSLSMFGALVSPKLRAAQLSFETALETLVEIANMRSSMLYAYDQVHEE